jgi:hypothetical protein
MYLLNQPNLDEFKFHLNRLNFLNRFKTEFEPRCPTLCWPGLPVGTPPLRCPAYPSPSHTTSRTPGLVAAWPHLSAAPRHPRPSALPNLPPHLRRARVLPPLTTLPGAIPAPLSGCRSPAAPSFSLSPSAAWHAQADPHFPLCSPRTPADLEKTSAPHSAPFHARA